MVKRTDLALEVHEMRGEQSGITVNESEKSGIKITIAHVSEGEGEKLSGKRAGDYITLEVGKVWLQEKSRLEEIASVIAEELEKILPVGKGGYLVAGLGNRSITPDAVGPLAVEGILVTRHLEEVQPQLYTAANFSSVSAIAPGVLGQTGIESAEIIKGLCQKIQPKCLILIDSLASRKLSRLATTVQISNRGISPGGGVSNKRMAIERETVGVPVISLGVPTVVDAATLAYDILEEYGGLDMEAAEAVMDRIMESKSREMFVTPKDNDIITARTAKLIAMALNMALHRMTAEELREFTD